MQIISNEDVSDLYLPKVLLFMAQRHQQVNTKVQLSHKTAGLMMIHWLNSTSAQVHCSRSMATAACSSVAYSETGIKKNAIL